MRSFTFILRPLNKQKLKILMIRPIICVQAWERLERAENERERVLRDELIRQEKLEQMARRFDRKAAMRETWLLENQRLVAQVKHQQQTMDGI